MSEAKKTEKNWYVLSKGKESGPFDYYQIVAKINEGVISTFDFIRGKNQDTWGAVADYEIFQFSSIIEEEEYLKDSAKPKDSRRRFERKPILADIFVKKSNILFKGKALEVGKGGMGFEASEDIGEPGGVINLYCSPISESISFNCKAKIVSRIEKPNGRFRYGIQFLKVSAKGQIFLARVLAALSKFEEK